MLPKKQGRKKSQIWFHFIEGLLLNSSYHEVKCKYCFDGVLTNMLKHLKEECSNVSKEICKSLHKFNNINNSAKKNNKRPRIETVELSDDDDNYSEISQITQKSMEFFIDKSMSMNKVIAIHYQLLHTLLLANISFSFVDNSEVIKLFKMLRPSYNLPL
ncbi:hypothetical protein C1645_833644 [Glomus cerebriforme]|uniref:BED-type domain-containing protein n=1 Tax=Glomus cerebriforme TaxID=658196 RepID=A0A397SFU4_9GLOM|nr:hypothetical protein C1645_833644 [Glomus cerebriforme]